MKYRLNLTSLLIALALACGQAGAQDIRCSQIENARERLECFDRQYPRDLSAPTTATDPYKAQRQTGPARAAAGAIPQEDLGPAGAPAPTAGTAAVQESKTDDKRGFGGELFGKREKVEISSRIRELRRRDGQKMMFLLENDQVWMQASPRDLPIREGDAVTITSGTVGGYLLATESGTTTRVQRIK